MSARYPHDDEVCRQNSIDAASFPDLCRQVASLQGERDELRATVARVAVLHTPLTDDDGTYCRSDNEAWPCVTAKALAGDQP